MHRLFWTTICDESNDSIFRLFGIILLSLKILKTNRPRHEVEADFAKEVQFLMNLRHPNIVCCYDAFQHNGFYHLVLEKCEGSLRHLRERFQLNENQIMDIAGQLFSGLQHIHGKVCSFVLFLFISAFSGHCSP